MTTEESSPSPFHSHSTGPGLATNRRRPRRVGPRSTWFTGGNVSPWQRWRLLRSSSPRQRITPPSQNYRAAAWKVVLAVVVLMTLVALQISLQLTVTLQQQQQEHHLEIEQQGRRRQQQKDHSLQGGYWQEGKHSSLYQRQPPIDSGRNHETSPLRTKRFDKIPSATESYNRLTQPPDEETVYGLTNSNSNDHNEKVSGDKDPLEDVPTSPNVTGPVAYPGEKSDSNLPPTSACMLIMDDNHWLIEWLAYHWTTVNLQYLIIAIDERSKTSPLPILDRWKGRMEYELWNDSHFFPPMDQVRRSIKFDKFVLGKDPNIISLQDINEERQQTFFAKCMQSMKQQQLSHQRNISWVLFTDSDEYMVINPRTNQTGSEYSLYREHVPRMEQRNSILQFLEQERAERGTLCHSMGRLQFSPDEVSPEMIQRDVPSFLNGSEFLTLRWIQPADDLVGPKNIVNLGAMNASEIPRRKTHQHRVLPSVCPEAGFRWNRYNSLIQIYHYLGTMEQFQFRDDARLSLGANIGRNRRYRRFSGKGKGIADELRPWVQTFLAAIGSQEEAMRLLEGVGNVQGWPSSDAHKDRFLQSMPILLPPLPFNASDETQMIDLMIETGRDVASAKDLLAAQATSQESTIFSIARKDRSGAIVADMMLAQAYAFSKNKTYGGACEMEPVLHRQSAEDLIAVIGLDKTLIFACPENKTAEVLDRSVYASQNTMLFTQEYLNFLRSRVAYPEKITEGAVLHVRRGDVSPCGNYSNRYLPNSHYLDILDQFVPKGTPVAVFSESDTMESFDDFANFTMFIDSELADAWRAMMTADYVVLSKSSFSFVPAMLNRNGTIIYTPFMQKKLPGWKTVGSDIMERSKENTRKLSQKLCGSPRKEDGISAVS